MSHPVNLTYSRRIKGPRRLTATSHNPSYINPLSQHTVEAARKTTRTLHPLSTHLPRVHFLLVLVGCCNRLHVHRCHRPPITEAKTAEAIRPKQASRRVVSLLGGPAVAWRGHTVRPYMVHVDTSDAQFRHAFASRWTTRSLCISSLDKNAHA
jgi:hypothetical protein